MTAKNSSADKTSSSTNSLSSDATADTTSARSTIAGPATPDASATASNDPAVAKNVATDALARSCPFNRNKPTEYGAAARTPPLGATFEPPTVLVTGSTLTEAIASRKIGAGEPRIGQDPGAGSLDRVRADASGQRITTNQGVPVADNHHSLKVELARSHRRAVRGHPGRPRHRPACPDRSRLTSAVWVLPGAKSSQLLTRRSNCSRGAPTGPEVDPTGAEGDPTGPRRVRRRT